MTGPRARGALHHATQLIGAALVAAPIARAPGAPREADAPAEPPGAEVVLLTLGEPEKDTVGLHVTADGVRRSLRMLPPSEAPRVTVLRIDSVGGMVAEVPRLSDLIENELEPEGRVVVWIDRALSAAALVALTADEIVMESDATIGAAVARDRAGAALAGEDLETYLGVGAEVARRGGRDPLVVRAMQTPTEVTFDEPEGSAPVLREGPGGRAVLNPPGAILTLSAERAERVGVSLGRADSLPELLALLGVPDDARVITALENDQDRFRDRAHLAAQQIERAFGDVATALAEARAEPEPAARGPALARAGAALDVLRRSLRLAPQAGPYFDITDDDLRELEGEIRSLR